METEAGRSEEYQTFRKIVRQKNVLKLLQRSLEYKVKICSIIILSKDKNEKNQ